MPCPAHRSTELKRFPGTNDSPINTIDPRHHLCQVAIDPPFQFRPARRQRRHDASDVAAVAPQQFAPVWRLQGAHLVGAQIVKAHLGQRVVHPTEGDEARDVDQIEAIKRRCRRRRDRTADDAALPCGIEMKTLITFFHQALFTLDDITFAWFGANEETVVSRGLAEVEINANRKARGMASGSSANLVDAAPVAQRVLNRIPKRIRDETKRVEKVALSRPIRPDEERKLCGRNVACGDALVVAQDDTGYQTAAHGIYHMMTSSRTGRETNGDAK